MLGKPTQPKTYKLSYDGKQFWLITYQGEWGIIKPLVSLPWLKRVLPSKTRLLCHKMTLSCFQKLMRTLNITSPEGVIKQVIFDKGLLLSFTLQFPRKKFYVQGAPPLLEGGELPVHQLTTWLQQFGYPKSAWPLSPAQVASQVARPYPPAPKNTTTSGTPQLWGGLTDNVKLTADPCFGYDVNSLYPFCLLSPIPTGNVQKNPDINVKQAFGIAKATLRHPALHIPVIPSPLDTQTRFQTGEWTGIYSTPELQYALSQGVKVKVHELYHYPQKSYLNHAMVHELFAQKRFTRIPFFKLCLNSLYGQLAVSKTRPQAQITLLPPKNPLYKAKLVGSPWWISKTTAKYKRNYPRFIWGCFVTAYARIQLHQLLSFQEKSLSYFDTDSLFLNSPWPLAYQGLKLGQLKKVTTPGSLGVFVSPKIYGLFSTKDVTLKFRGVQHPTTQLLLTLKNLNHPLVHTPVDVPFIPATRRNYLSNQISWPLDTSSPPPGPRSVQANPCLPGELRSRASFFPGS